MERGTFIIWLIWKRLLALPLPFKPITNWAWPLWYERRTLYFVECFRAACNQDPTNVEVRDWLTFRNNNLISDWLCLLHDSWDEMVWHGHVNLVSPPDVGLYHGVDPELASIVSILNLRKLKQKWVILWISLFLILTIARGFEVLSISVCPLLWVCFH